MREKYEKATRAQEVFQKQLELANAKIKKLQAENDLLLDAMLVNDEALFNRFFPSANLPNPPLAPGIGRDHHHTHHRHAGPPPPPPLRGPNAAPRHPSHNSNHFIPPEGPNNQHQQLRTPIDREPENRSGMTIRIVSSGPAPRRSRRLSQNQQHPALVNHPNAEPSSGVGASYGRYPITLDAQPNGNGNGGGGRAGSPHPPPPPPGPPNPNHIINLGGPLPPQHINGPNEGVSSVPPPTQVPLYDRPLEFIQHEPNGRA
ncbi:hypothetical protein EST38_g999 [Candolleomyces aberdarensis]|uniref:Uncharacterized protein n=1 Tax=Candolleomyces aberdarensis TaxID=2316362 RepID=A0A4Q2DW11_9AGAR|nr:hypothetical protein EST38_g999 [Candolleomyces aberdarensis]